jgi:acetyltransferase-like isoleucine patch superfamily enzyme
MHTPELPPPPGQATLPILLRCRQEIEARWKRRLRSWLLPIIRWRLGVEEVGEGFQWGWPMKIASKSRIGRFVYIGSGFECEAPVSIGDLCMISSDCKVVGSDHLTNIANTPSRLAFSDSRLVTIFGVDAWIGRRVIIREGLVIGSGSVVGAGSTVVRDVEPYSVVAGNPAKLIKHRYSPDIRYLHDRAVVSSIV